MRRVLIAAALMASSPALAQTPPDPTFNGLFDMVTCYSRSSVVCRGDECMQPAERSIGGQGGGLIFNLKARTYGETIGLQRPLDIVKLSSPELNKPLSIVANVELQAMPWRLTMTMRPLAGGSYFVLAVAKLLNPQPPQVSALVLMECTRPD